MGQPVRLTGHVLSSEPLLAAVDVPSRALEIDGPVLRVDGTEIELQPGDGIEGERNRLLPGPWWWTLTFRLASRPEDDVVFTAPGIGSFLGWLEQDGWSIDRSKRTFRATFPGRPQR